MNNNLQGVQNKRQEITKQKRQQARQKLLLRKTQRQLSLKQKMLLYQDEAPTDADENTVINSPEVSTDVQQVDEAQKQQTKRQQDKIDELQGQALQKIDQIQKEIDRAQSGGDPSKSIAEQVFDVVKKQIELKDQEQALVPTTEQSAQAIQQHLTNQQEQHPQIENYRDLSLPFSRRNYLSLVNQLISKMEDLTAQQKQKLYQRYRYTRKPGQKLETQAQLFTKLNALYGKYESWKQGHQRVNFILKKMQSEKRFLENKPQKWYVWYLSHVQHLQPKSEMWQTMSTVSVMTRERQRRLEYLQEKRQKIMTNIHYYYRKYQQTNLQRVKKLTQLMEQRTNVYQQQKKTLAFLIDEKNNQISSLSSQIESDKVSYQNKLENLRNQAIKIIEQQKQKQKQLQQEVLKLQNKSAQQSKELKQKQDLLVKQRQVISQQEAKNKQQELQLAKAHEQNMALKAQLLETHQKSLNDLHVQKQSMQRQFNQQIAHMQAIMQNTLAGKHMAEQQFNIMVNTNQQNMYKLQLQNQQRIRGKQAEFAEYQQRVKAQFARQASQFQAQLGSLMEENRKSQLNRVQLMQQSDQLLKNLEDLRAESNFSKEKQQQLLTSHSKLQQKLSQIAKESQQQKKREGQLNQKVKAVKQQSQKDQITYKRVMENKIEEITQKLRQSEDKSKQERQKYQKKLKEIQQNKQKQISALVEQLKLTGTQKQKLELQALAMKQELANMNSILEKYSQRKEMQMSYLTWKRDEIFTIRQCFRQKNKEDKWIASTRGVNIPISHFSSVKEIVEYWVKIYQAGDSAFPKQKQVLRLRGTEVLSILDRYKQVNYFGLRQGYWKQGDLLPTRRGFNVSWAQMPQFFRSFRSMTPLDEIKNHY